METTIKTLKTKKTELIQSTKSSFITAIKEKNPELLKQMGKHSKYYLSHKYNEKKITDKLRNVYNSIK